MSLFISVCFPVEKKGHPVYTLSLSSAVEGRNCETEVNECLSQPCQNGGSCLDELDSFRCRCPAGITGVAAVAVWFSLTGRIALFNTGKKSEIKAKHWYGPISRVKNESGTRNCQAMLASVRVGGIVLMSGSGKYICV